MAVLKRDWWTEEKKTFLTDNYPHFGGLWVADRLGITIKQVRHKANRLGLLLLDREQRRCVNCNEIDIRDNGNGRRSGLRCLKCYSERKKLRRRENGKPRKERWAELLRSARKRSSKHCDLTVEYLEELYNKQEGKCAYSGIQMEFAKWGSGRKHYSVSLDQIVPGGGYTRDNVALVCWVVNSGKSNMSLNEYVAVCKSIACHCDVIAKYLDTGVL